MILPTSSKCCTDVSRKLRDLPRMTSVMPPKPTECCQADFQRSGSGPRCRSENSSNTLNSSKSQKAWGPVQVRINLPQNCNQTVGRMQQNRYHRWSIGSGRYRSGDCGQTSRMESWMPGSGVETDRRTSQLWSSTPAKNALNLEAEPPLGEYFPFQLHPIQQKLKPFLQIEYRSIQILKNLLA